MTWKDKLIEIDSQLETEDANFLESHPELWDEIIRDTDYNWEMLSRTQYIPEELMDKLIEIPSIDLDLDWDKVIEMNDYNFNALDRYVEKANLDLERAIQIIPEYGEYLSVDNYEESYR